MTPRLKIMIGTILVVAVTATVSYWLGHNDSLKSTPAQTIDKKTADTSGKKILYWYDPMVPNQHFDKPGKSPFMDMELVPKYDEPNQTTGSITIDPRTIQNLGIRTAKVTTGSLSQSIHAVGYVKPDERRIKVVQARAAGWVEQLSVRAANDSVKQGQLLAAIYSPELLAAQEEYLLVRKSAAQHPDDKLLIEAARQKLALLGVSEAQIRQLERTGKSTRQIAYFSPTNGIVSELGTREGAQVSPGMTLFSLLDLSTIWVIADIPENQSHRINIGSQATILFSAYPDQPYQGRVESIYPQIAENSRTLQVRIPLTNPEGRLKPGMYANLNLAAQQKMAVLLVPSEAVIPTGKRSVVIVAEEEGKFRPVEVTIGQEENGQTEILSGLSAGQTIVSSGQFLIDSESNLKTSLARLAPLEKP